MRPAITPTDVTTSVTMCRPSATRAGDFSLTPTRISHCAQNRLMTAAAPLIDKPSQGCSSETGDLPGAPDLGKDQQRRKHDQHALKDGGEILRLVMAEGMVLVGGLVADADGPEGGERSDDIDDRFERV